MSETRPSAAFRDVLEQIERISQLSEGLAIVILAGPATHAPEALEQIATMLGSEREVVRHPLDSRGAALTESLTSIALPSALLVYGMEWLTGEERAEIEAGLNLSRDSLARSRVLIVFWIELRYLDEFRQRCPDLFHWRSLLLTLSEEDLPLPDETVELRLHAQHLQEARPIPANLYFEPLLVVAGTEESIPLSAWATQVDHGCLEGPFGSGKSIGVAMYAAGQARRATEVGGIVPCLITARYSGVPEGLDLDLERRMGSEPKDLLSATLLDSLARNGNLQILVDGFDEIPAKERDGWMSWLYQLRRDYPRLRTFLVSRPGILESEDWRRAEVLPWDRKRILAFLERTSPFDRGRFPLDYLLEEKSFRELARSPLLLTMLVDTHHRLGQVPLDRASLLGTYVEILLQRDEARSLSKLRPTSSPQTLRRQLAEIAIKLLERGTQLIHLEDFKGLEEIEEELPYLLERTALIQKISNGSYAFGHRILFEHFAAEGLVDLGVQKAVDLMLEHQDDPLWKEVTAIASSRLLKLGGERDPVARERLARLLARQATMKTYDRDQETKTLWRYFKAGRNVLMLAPRRTGKTVLLHQLKAQCDKQGYYGIVLDVEGFADEKDFFRELCGSIQEETGIGRSLLGALGNRLKDIVRRTEIAAEDWRDILLHVEWSVFGEHLLAQLERRSGEDHRGWLILVDEITIFVQALLNRHGKERASDFLHGLRRLARAHPRVQWLFTGSIGLDSVARRHGFESALIDLEIFPLGPFDRATAVGFVRQIAYNNECVVAADAVDAMLDRLGWLSPFYLLKFAEAACDKSRGGAIERVQVDQAAEELLSVARRTHWSFWREHLDKNFLEPERSRLFTILAVLCRSPEGASLETLLQSLNPGGAQVVREADLRDALDSLETDGYLTIDAKRSRIRFRMNLLREWWDRYVATPVG